MKIFYVVCGDRVEKITLRETPKYYIDDKRNRKFKKTDNQDYLAHYRYNGGSWHSLSYYVYDVDHEIPLNIIDKNNRSMFIWKVKKAAEEYMSKSKSYEDFVRINEILGLGVE